MLFGGTAENRHGDHTTQGLCRRRRRLPVRTGHQTPDQIKAVVDAVAPKPVNLLTGFADLTLTQIGNLGVRRVSVGGALARAAWGGFMRAAKLIIEDGSFHGFTDAASGGELNKFFDSH